MIGPFFSFMSSVTWAVGSSGYSKLSRSYSPFAVNFSRALVALPLFVLATFVTEGGWQGGVAAFGQLKLHHLGWYSLSMVASYGLGDVLFLWSTRSLGVPGALAIASSYPLWTGLFGILGQGEPVAFRQLAGLLVTVAGVVTVILMAPAPGAAAGESASVSVSEPGNGLRIPEAAPVAAPVPRLQQRGVGVALAFATSFLWALNTFSVSRGGHDLSAPVANVLRMMLAMGLITVLGRVMSPRGGFMLPASALAGSLWLFAFEAFGGSYAFVYGLAHSSLVVGSTMSSLAPVIAVPVAWFAGLERVSWARTAGVAAVVFGLWLLIL